MERKWILGMKNIRQKISVFYDKKKQDIKMPDMKWLREKNVYNPLIKSASIFLGIAVFCTLFLLLLSASTSPLYTDFCDGDSSIFMLIGKGITRGKEVYRDYFDHKGPILFYLNALGFTLTGTKTGVFIIQCVMLTLTSVFMYKTARLFTKTIRSVICVVIALLAFASTISDGNLSEEYCMLFCIIPIYFSIKFYKLHINKPHPPKYMAIYGICFAVCAFIRINNGIMIGGIVLVTVITEFAAENIKNALINIAAFFVGMLIVAVPICLFFIIKGTFSDMIFSTFTFNFMYAAEGGAEKSENAVWLLLQWTIPILALVVVSAVFSKRLGPKIASLLTTVAVFALIPVLMGFSYTHYYTSLIPLLSVYCAVFFHIAGKRYTFLSVLLCIIMSLPLYSYFITLPFNISHYTNKIYRQNNPSVYKDIHTDIHYSASELSAFIPNEDRDSVFGYDISSAWFLEADIMPCYRLFTLQEAWASHYPEFGREINQMMLDNPPKWVVIHNIDIIESRQFLSIIKGDYELVAEFGYDLLYKHKQKV